jgi:hypothetical protein
MSHGWGAAALVAMQEVLLGVVPTAPPPDGPPTLVTVAPPAGGLAHAAGVFPTPAGECSVAWQAAGAGTALTIVVPPNAAAQCRLPATTASRVRERGVPVERARGVTLVGTADGVVDVSVGAGHYDFTVSAE